MRHVGVFNSWVAIFAVIGAAGVARANPAVDEGLALLDAWQLEDALALSQRLLAEDPDSPAYWLLAGYVQHQRGEHLSALALLDAAREAGGETGYVHELVASSAAYAAHFQTLDTDHFRIRYLNKDEIVAHYAAPILEAAYTNIGGALEFLPAEGGERIVVEIYPDARGLAGATGLTVQEIATSGTIAVCKFHRLMLTSPLATADGYAWADTAAHEFTHLVISKKSHNSIPIWLHEGIAKFYESTWYDRPGLSLEPYAEKMLADAVKSRKLITYRQMHPSMAKLPSQEDAALAFAEVFTTIEYLTGRFGKRSIPRVLALTGKGVALERALRQVFKLDLGGVESAWQRWLAKRKFRIVPGAARAPIRFADSNKESQNERPLETIADREVHDFSRLGEMLQLRGHHHAAIREYEKAHALSGSRYVTLIYRLARAYLAARRPDDALGILDEALSVHPDSSDAHLLAGRIRLQRREVDAAQHHYEAVRLQNPFNPEIHQALGEIYAGKGWAQKAQLEKRMQDLAANPRPARSYALPPPPAGNARLALVAPGWSAVRIDAGEPQPTPLWDRPIEAGRHTIEYRKASGAMATREIDIAVGERLRLVLP